MSIAIRTKRLTEKFSTSSIPEPAFSISSAEREAPERAVSQREAPESPRTGYHAEAPDAGDGRANYLEHEFTCGRSQS